MTKKIIVAPLNWGLGHASRCVPIIKSLIEDKFSPVIASDGAALEFLKKEFPSLEFLELPSYNISYGKNFRWKLFLKAISFQKIIKKEQQVLQQYLNQNMDVVGIISDNRFGIRAKEIPSVYITHQINVLFGALTPITSYFHQRIIKQFDECWIPDEEGSQFSGRLSTSNKQLNQQYIGIQSRFEKKEAEKTIDTLIVLSGPEPNRTHLENKLLQAFRDSDQKVCLVQGKLEEHQKIAQLGSVKLINFMLSDELEQTMNAAEIVICRSGYSSVMDLVSLNRKALLIPTKNQTEQEYLAKELQQKNYFRFVDEEDFSIKSLDSIKGESHPYKKKEFDASLFCLFQRKGEF